MWLKPFLEHQRFKKNKEGIDILMQGRGWYASFIFEAVNTDAISLIGIVLRAVYRSQDIERYILCSRKGEGSEYAPLHWFCGLKSSKLRASRPFWARRCVYVEHIFEYVLVCRCECVVVRMHARYACICTQTRNNSLSAAGNSSGRSGKALCC